MARLKRYTLQELMDECSPLLPRSAADQAWLDIVPVGLEVEGLDAQRADSAPSQGDRRNHPCAARQMDAEDPIDRVKPE